MNPISLEERLGAALSARAEQVHGADLAPADPPATVTPLLRRRLRPTLYVAAAAAAAAVVAMVVVTTGDDAAGPAPAAPSTVIDSPAPAPSRTPTTTPPPVDPELQGPLDEDPEPFVAAGTEVRFLNGRGSIVGDELVVTDRDGTTRRTTIADASGAMSLSPVEQQLGQAGSGFLVDTAATGDTGDTGDTENAPFALFVGNAEGDLTPATVTGNVPFGRGTSYGRNGRAYYTYSTGNGTGLYTRIVLGDPDGQRYTVYRWQVPGPGEGGYGPPEPVSREIELVPTKVGVFCLDLLHGTGERC